MILSFAGPQCLEEDTYTHTHPVPGLHCHFDRGTPCYYSQIMKHGIADSVCALYTKGTANPRAGWDGLNTSSPQKEKAWQGAQYGTLIPYSTAPLEILVWLQLAQERAGLLCWHDCTVLSVVAASLALSALNSTVEMIHPQCLAHGMSPVSRILLNELS